MISILLIEDDEPFCITLKEGLENAGHDVAIASGGIDGFNMYNSKKFDLVVTDIFMKEGDGIETLQWIKEINPDTPLIAISGQPMYLNFIKKLGATAILKKPFKVEELIKTINNLTCH